MKLTTALTTALILGTICLGTGLASTSSLPAAAGTPSSPRVATNGNGIFTCAQMNGRQGMGRLNQGTNQCMTQNCRMQNRQAMMGQGMADQQRCGRQVAHGCLVNGRQGMGRGHHQTGQVMTGRMGAGYLTMDPETRKRHDDFRAATTELRRTMTAKRAEKQAVMRSTSPDPALAAQLAGDLFDLHDQMRRQAREAGIAMARGGAAGYGHGMREPLGGARW